MDTQRCSTCNGEGHICAHGWPASQCAIADPTSSCHNTGDLGPCDDCDGRGWIVPKLRWQAVQVSTGDEGSHEAIESRMNDGFEPFAVTDFHVWLRRAVPA